MFPLSLLIAAGAPEVSYLTFLLWSIHLLPETEWQQTMPQGQVMDLWIALDYLTDVMTHFEISGMLWYCSWLFFDLNEQPQFEDPLKWEHLGKEGTLNSCFPVM